MFQTWGHLPIVSEGQHNMNTKPWSHWAKEAETETRISYQRDENEGEKLLKSKAKKSAWNFI